MSRAIRFLPSFSKTLLSTVVAACLAAMPLAAQDAAGDSSQIGEGLSLGATAEPQVGETYLLEEHGDWQIRCVRVNEGEDPCQLYQLLQDQEGNSVAEINLFAIGDNGPAAAGATIITPLETLLTQQIRLSIEGQPDKFYPFNFCSQIGCVARVGFTQDEVDTFKAGSTATLVIVPARAPDQTVDLTISLIGFTAGFEAVAALAP